MINRESIIVQHFRQGTASACLCNVLFLVMASGCASTTHKSPLVPQAQTVGSTSAAGPDGDDDGVPDEFDKCAATLVQRPVDEQGCALFEGKLENVEFQPDAHSLDASSRQALDRLIAKMTAHPSVVLAVSGHTDNRGNARDNLELSKKRVLAVVRYLVLNGVDGRRLQPHGYGESRPLFSNATPEGRSRNRRIEITQISAN